MSEFGGSFIWRPCLLHLNRFNSLFIYQLLPFVPLWYSRWCILGNDNDLTNLTLLPSFLFWAERATQSSKGSSTSGHLRGTVLLAGNIFVSLSTQVALGLATHLRESNAFSIDSVRLGVYTWNITTAKLTSTVSYMIALSHKRAPTPYFGAISCIGSKFTQMSLHLGVSFVLHLRNTAWTTMPVAAEQKYDWGDCHERLRSSRSSAWSVCVRRSKIGRAKAPLAPWFCCPCTMHIWGKKLCVILHQRLLQGIFA